MTAQSEGMKRMDICSRLSETAAFFKRWPLYVADPESRVVNDPALLIEAKLEIERLRTALREAEAIIMENALSPTT